MIVENLFNLAMKHYDNPSCKTIEEFDADYQKFILIKKLLNKKIQNPRLVLNHIITLFNVFEKEACVRILFQKIDSSRWSDLKTYLVYLNYMVESIPEIGLYDYNIPLNQYIVDELRKI